MSQDNSKERVALELMKIIFENELNTEREMKLNRKYVFELYLECLETVNGNNVYNPKTSR